MKKKTTPKKAIQPVTPKVFNTIAEIIEDPVFVKFVQKNVSELVDKRSKRPPCKPGYHYIRDWFDRMPRVSSGFFLENIEAVWTKKSDLSSEIRAIILYVADASLKETLPEYSVLENKKV